MVSSSGPVWGPSEDHAYYVKLAAMPTPAPSAENNARSTVTCHNAALVMMIIMTSWS